MCVCLCLYLRDAGDDVRVFAGVVFLVAAENSDLSVLQDVDLKRRESQKHNREFRKKLNVLK